MQMCTTTTETFNPNRPSGAASSPAVKTCKDRAVEKPPQSCIVRTDLIKSPETAREKSLDRSSFVLSLLIHQNKLNWPMIYTHTLHGGHLWRAVSLGAWRSRAGFSPRASKTPGRSTTEETGFGGEWMCVDEWFYFEKSVFTEGKVDIKAKRRSWSLGGFLECALIFFISSASEGRRAFNLVCCRCSVPRNDTGRNFPVLVWWCTNTSKKIYVSITLTIRNHIRDYGTYKWCNGGLEVRLISLVVGSSDVASKLFYSYRQTWICHPRNQNCISECLHLLQS